MVNAGSRRAGTRPPWHNRGSIRIPDAGHGLSRASARPSGKPAADATPGAARSPRRSCCSPPRPSLPRSMSPMCCGRAGRTRRSRSMRRRCRSSSPGVAFNVEPAAIRVPVQRRPGTQSASTSPICGRRWCRPDPARKATVGAPVDPNERLFVTIQTGDGTLPLLERVQTIYPRYLVPEPTAGPDGLTLRGFRDDTPYQGEELVFESAGAGAFPGALLAHAASPIPAPACWSGASAMPTSRFRFPRDWLSDWQSVASGIDRLIARLHPIGIIHSISLKSRVDQIDVQNRQFENIGLAAFLDFQEQHADEILRRYRLPANPFSSAASPREYSRCRICAADRH